jgi:hypothetical protein
MNSTGLNSNGLAQSSFVGGLPKLSAKPHGRRPMGQGSIGSPSAIKPQSPFGDVFGTLNKLSSHLDAAYAEHNKPLPVEGKGLTAYRTEDNHYKLASLMLKVRRGAAVNPYGTAKSASWNPYDLISDKTYERRGHQLTSMLSALNSFPKVWLGKDFFPDADKLKYQLTMNDNIAKGDATIHDYHRWKPMGESKGFLNRVNRAVQGLPPIALARGLWAGGLNDPSLGLSRNTADTASEYLSYAGNPVSMARGLLGAASSVPKLLSAAPSAIRAVPAAIKALPSMASAGIASVAAAPVSSAYSAARTAAPWARDFLWDRLKSIGMIGSAALSSGDRNWLRSTENPKQIVKGY